ncbi:hypothetical protein PGB90_002645 [Kerria lacca]
MKTKISKILIANRGEIACRIVKSARKLGIKTVAVYSEVDKNSRNVLMCDEAYCIGKAPSQDSYLNQGKIINVAKKSNCDAIHPGYGFLSENAVFSENCLNNNIIFIGPPASAIRNMGIKSMSKKIMCEAGVPIIPGYHDTDQSNLLLKHEAERIGYPLMIKAVHGGGGKGMRIVFNHEEFLTKLESARRESLNSFGDENMLLEKYIVAPRHIEVQIFADQHGNCIHLNERDCSIQRRHQKIIEEAPAPTINARLREKIGTAAIHAANAVNYIGAGTVEFIYEKSTKNFYFMEMNTRLQVEHPITEMITNVDLVEWQIKIANGEELPLKQSDIPLNGHSVEARIYAEDPYNEFLPGAGPLIYFSLPTPTKNVRIETGICEGDEVSVHYDPLIAKLVVWGENRNEAYSKLHSKLLECNIVGLNTNVEFLTKLSTNEKLLNGEVNTAFIEENKTDLLQKSKPSSRIIAQAALGLVLLEEDKQLQKMKISKDRYDPFITERGFRINHSYTRDLKFINSSGQEYNFKITYNKTKSYTIEISDQERYEIDGYLIAEENGKTSLITNFADETSKCKIFIQDNIFIHVFTQEGSFCFEIWFPKYIKSLTELGTKATTVAPVPGIVSKILIKAGDEVSVGDSIMVIIAMKMEHVIKSSKNGVIKDVLFKVGDNVSKNALVIKFQED